MSKKAVYNNQYLGIYITRDDLDKLLEDFETETPVYIGKYYEVGASVRVQLNLEAKITVRGALEAEREAVASVRALANAQLQD